MITKRTALAPLRKIRTNFFLIGFTIVLCLGWSQRDNNYLTAESGTGYILGIVGSSLMLTLLLYPVSKRVKALTRWIPIRYWFGVHMFLGSLGPTLVLFHSNFHLGSTNSTVAMISMLLVAGSGLIGRYIYTHIHHGLYGSQISLNELKQESENNHIELLKMYAMDEALNSRLKKMEEKVLQPYTGLLTNMLHVISLEINAHKLKFKVMSLVRESYANSNDKKSLPDSKAVINSVNRYTLALRKAAAFRVYERLFSLWHILHLPLFFMMIITAVIHIFAVHLY